MNGGEYGYTRDDLLDCIEDLMEQSCGLDNGDLDHAFMSSYEDAMDLLVACRPQRWELTHHGARRLELPNGGSQ